MKRLEYVALSFLALIILAMWALVYMAFVYQNPPIVFNNSPFPVEPVRVRAGDELIVTVDRCRYTNVPVTIHRVWINDLVHFQPPAPQSGAPAGCSVDRISVDVPADLPPGHYHIFYRFEYVVSPISFPRIVEAESMPFEVIR